MKNLSIRQSIQFVILALVSYTLIGIGCKKSTQVSSITATNLVNFSQVNLIASNASYRAGRVDTLLLDAYGIAFSPSGNIWLSSQVSGLSFIDDKEGNQLLAPVSIPSPTAPNGGAITGLVYNGSSDFVLSNMLPAKFIFAGADGIISGWNPGTKFLGITVVDNSATSAYNGITLATNAGMNYIYAANIKTGAVDVFDGSFKPLKLTFKDPALPMQYSPFDIKEIDGKLYVLYAKVDSNRNQMIGAGFGIINIFNTDGSFVKRFVSNGQLNAPWGITKAPDSFFGSGAAGTNSTVLVGNFGDGQINAYSTDGMFIGPILSNGKPLVIDGLWGISFAPATATTIDPNRLYFEAGPKGETEGLFGYIKK